MKDLFEERGILEFLSGKTGKNLGNLKRDSSRHPVKSFIFFSVSGGSAVEQREFCQRYFCAVIFTNCGCYELGL